MRQSPAVPGAEALPSRPPSGPSLHPPGPDPPRSWLPGGTHQLAALRKQPSPPAGQGGGAHACPRISPWVTTVCSAPKTRPVLCLTNARCFPGFPQVLIIFPATLIVQRVTSFSNALVALTFALGVSELAKAVPSKSLPWGTLSQGTSPDPVRAAGHSGAAYGQRSFAR